MKRISKIARYAKTILPLCCLASCSYLDVVPPETEDIKDMMKNEDATLSLYILAITPCNGDIPTR